MEYLVSIILALVMTCVAEHKPPADLQSTQRGTCLSEADVAQGLAELSRLDVGPAYNQKRAELLDSGRTGSCQQDLSDKIIKTMENAAIDFNRNGAVTEWREGADLLSELRSPVGTAFLIEHLSLEIGASSSRSLRHRPAIGALIDMGPFAVPQLSVELRQTSQTQTKLDIVYCLTNIGLAKLDNLESKHVLMEAQKVESDACVNDFLKLSIEVLNSRSKEPERTSTSGDEILGRWNRMFLSRCGQSLG